MNDYASRQRTPSKHLVGIGVVLVLHILIFWAINSGLARKFVKVVKGPVETLLLEDAKPDIPHLPDRDKNEDSDEDEYRQGYAA